MSVCTAMTWSVGGGRCHCLRTAKVVDCVVDGFNIDIDVRNFLIRCQLVPSQSEVQGLQEEV